MDLSLLAKGALLGLSIAAPVGPIGVLCIKRTLAEGRRYGFVAGLGAATADAAYGAIAAFGLTALTARLLGASLWLRLGGGLFLCYLGLKTLLAAPAERPAAVQGAGLAHAYLSTVLLTLTNPATILSFLAMFAGAGLGSAGSAWDAAALVAGVFGGSALWWLLLSSGVGLFGDRLGQGGLRWVNRLSGLIILTFGVLSLLSLI
jgi:threonine/homoserine/homoserine lactone efflux protein